MDEERKFAGALVPYEPPTGSFPRGASAEDGRRQGHGRSGPRDQFFSGFSFSDSANGNRREQSFSAFHQEGSSSQFAFGTRTLGKNGNLKQGFGFMASQDEHGSHFKMESIGKNHKFSLDISSGGHSSFAMNMQQGKGGSGFSMSLGAKGPGGPGLALQSGKHGLSMMIGLSGAKPASGGMNMSLQMGGKGGLGMNLQMGDGQVNIGLGKEGVSIGIGGASGGKSSGKSR